MTRSCQRIAAMGLVALAAPLAFGGAATATGTGTYPLSPVPFTRVRLTDTFWAPRVETNRRVTTPFGFRKSEEEGRIRNFERAALDLPMTVRRVVADQRVMDDRGKVALERGPLVYCVEGIDNGGSILDMVVPDGASFRVEDRPGLLHGVTVLRAEVSDGRGRPRSLLAVPYYAWSHRGAGEMAVWLTRGAATPPSRP